MNLTQEQQNVVDYIQQSTKEELILIDSVAGSGKTTLLKAISQAVPAKNGLYLAYNKAIATSSKKKFPTNVDCRTTHSLAYKHVVIPLKLKVGFFGPKEIANKIPYQDKVMLVEDIREFCLSSYLTYDEYAKACGRGNSTLANHYLNLMYTGKIDCTHDFYLKAFHIALAKGNVNFPVYGLLMLDEAGDLNEVTLEIFKLLPATIKVAVGDPHQNIYTFNHTINCFEKLEGQGITFNLSKSFRVPNHIAKQMEKFCTKYLNPNMVFEGVDPSSTTVKTRGYISRTNAGLINKMIELNKEQTPYGLVRKAQEIFKVPLIVAGLKYQGKIYDPAYRHLQEDVDDWYENKDGLKQSYPSLFNYLTAKYEDDFVLLQSINLVTKHGTKGIFDAYGKAKEHENKKQDFMLLTAHSSKGLEFDEVIISTDLNASVDRVLEAQDEDDPITKETLNLYYVACTRALVRLQNARHLLD
jgi:superfamily I DNA/RNA helicase